MSRKSKGVVVMPTGSGKTICQIADAKRHLYDGNTVVVVAPRILLAQQLCDDYMQFIENDTTNVLHVHSGKSTFDNMTNPGDIRNWWMLTPGSHIMFTTYHSLHRIQESGVPIDAIYFDEAHYTLRRDFYPVVEHFSHNTSHCYFFTATPKYSVADDKVGMNHTDVFGDTIYECPASDMIQGGYIVPPRLITTIADKLVDGKYNKDVDVATVIDTIRDNKLNSSLICCKNTTQLFYINTSPEFLLYTTQNDFTVFHTSSKYGSVVDGVRVSDRVFFNRLRQCSDSGDKFLLFHVSRISEGISLHGLESVILLKRMSTSTLTQTIGRALRLQDNKTEGKVILPCYSKYLKKTQKFTQQLVQRVYVDGHTPIETIRR